MAVDEGNESVKGYLGKATKLGREIFGAKIQDVKHYTGSGANNTKQGSNDPCAEIMCMAHPDNTGRVWVRTGTTATVNNAWPLNAGEEINFNVANLDELRMLIETSGEKLIVAYA